MLCTSTRACTLLLLLPLLFLLLSTYLHGIGRTLQLNVILANTLTGYQGEPANSPEYNAALRLINLLGLNAPTSVQTVQHMIAADDCPSVEAIRSGRHQQETTRSVNNNGYNVNYTRTLWGNPSESESEFDTPDLTIFYAHGGGMVTGCTHTYQSNADDVAEIWKTRLSLSTVQTVNVAFRNLPRATMEEAISDFLAVYAHFVETQQVDPATVVFEGCSGGGSMVLFSYLQLLRQQLLPKPLLILSHSPGPGLEQTPHFLPWEESDAWSSNAQHNEQYFFSNAMGKQWGLEWDETSRTTLKEWLSDAALMNRLGAEVVITSAAHEMFHHPHEQFMHYYRETTGKKEEDVSSIQYLSFPNRTHCLQALGFTKFTGPDGEADERRIFQSIQKVWKR